VLVALAIGTANPAFWDPANLFGLMRANIVVGIMALGVLVVLVSGGIDVSFPPSPRRRCTSPCAPWWSGASAACSCPSPWRPWSGCSSAR
jgi:hypothetical protein